MKADPETDDFDWEYTWMETETAKTCMGRVERTKRVLSPAQPLLEQLGFA